MFHQPKANMICQNRHALKHGGKHRDPRCSLACRDNWAELEAALLVEQLRRVLPSHHIYFGNIQIKSDLTLAGYILIRKRFLALFRRWKKANNCEAEFRAVSEIGPRTVNRIHFHYCVYADCPIPHGTMRPLWERACEPFPITLDHDPPKKGIEAASKYLFKDLKRFKDRKKWIWLFDYHTIQITWQTRGFFSPNRQLLLKLVRRQWMRGGNGTP